MKSIILASNNKDKVKEVKEILKGYDIISMKEAGIDVDIEENGTTFEENALIKARAIMKLTCQITMADDSGLEIDYLNKAPGVYSARFMGHDTSYDIKNKALIQKLEGVKGSDRSGRFVCAIAVCFPDGREIVKRGTMEGLIAEARRRHVPQAYARSQGLFRRRDHAHAARRSPQPRHSRRRLYLRRGAYQG